MAAGRDSQAQYQMKCALGSGRVSKGGESVCGDGGGGGHYVKTIYTLFVISIYIPFH